MLFKTLFITLLVSVSSASWGQNWQQYQVSGLAKRQLRADDIAKYISEVQQQPESKVTLIGKSEQGRPIYRIRLGHGPINVLMWSQMHGDESTATAALFDLLNYIHQHPDWLASWQNKISLYLIPMLNPDGAQVGRRFNAQDIDINRDARHLQTPEGQILMAQAKQIKPDFGFNLHDQNDYYAVGLTDKTATISLLAPAFDAAKDMKPSRRRAIKLAASLVPLAEQLIPGHIGRYNDTFSPRAFGDNMSIMGISTILIESGAYPNDPARQVARKVNLALYHQAINYIASGQWQKVDEKGYWNVPMNRSHGFKDAIFTGVEVHSGNNDYHVDIGLHRIGKSGQMVIDEVGDLSVFTAFYQLDASDWSYQACLPATLPAHTALSQKTYLSLLQKGQCYFLPTSSLTNDSGWPVVMTRKDRADRPLRGERAAFMLTRPDGRKMAVLDGKVIDLQQAKLLNP